MAPLSKSNGSAQSNESQPPDNMKVTIVGGGGFRTPISWEAIALVPGVEQVTLHDIDRRRLASVAAAIEGLRREGIEGPPVSTTTDLAAAVEDSDFVLCAIRVGGLEARVVDERVPIQHGVLGQETIGPGGICFALRTVPVALRIAQTVAARAPHAWFLNFTNPAGLVTEAVHTVLGDRAVGICDAPAALFARVAAALHREPRQLRFDYSGLNHLGWLLNVYEGEQELLAGLLDNDERLSHIEEARLLGLERTRALGMLSNEYLIYYTAAGGISETIKRSGLTRAQVILEQERSFYAASPQDPQASLAAWRRARDARFGSYMAEARGALARDQSSYTGSSDTDGVMGYAAIAAAFMRAIAGRGPATIVLNVANRGRIQELDDHAVVEVPCDVTKGAIETQRVGRLPASQRTMIERVKSVDRLTIRASQEGSRALALEAMALHPLVPSRAVAELIINDYFVALPSLAESLP